MIWWGSDQTRLGLPWTVKPGLPRLAKMRDNRAMDKATVDPLLLAFLPLIGVVVGGLVGFFASWIVEERRWHHQKRDHLLQDRRDALQYVLNWIALVNGAIAAAEQAIDNLDNPGSQEPWAQNFEDTVLEFEFPTRAKILLPSDLQDRMDPIVLGLRHMDDLEKRVRSVQAEILRVGPESWDKPLGVRLNMVEQLVKELKETFTLATEFEREIREEFLRTYA